MEQLTYEDLLRLASEEMALIQRYIKRATVHTASVIGISAISDQIYRTNQMLGRTKND